MQSAVTIFKCVNWRTVLIWSTCLLVVHFLLSFDINTQPKEDGNFPGVHTTPTTGGPVPESPKLFDPQNDIIAADAYVEPSPVLGDQYDSPLDAIPNRKKPPSVYPTTSVIDDAANANEWPEDEIPDTNDPADDEEYVAICLAAKDQSHDLPEWLTHHYHHIGIRRFYIMDDGSNPALSSFEYGIPKSALTFHYQDPATRTAWQQLAFYSECNSWYGSNHTWIAYIDTDEFLEITAPNETLVSILKGFDPDKTVGALGVNWKTHTSAGILTRPESARKSFTTCMSDPVGEVHGDNTHIKSIVRTSSFAASYNPHKFTLIEGTMTVGEHGDVINTDAFRNPITRDRIALHHYVVKSKEEYEEKMHRGNAMSQPKSKEFWDHVENDEPLEECTEMARFSP
ncbi:uncharacterized protein BP5553_04717 [Venustampulla echinocandica]|uniref:Glycosyltransferase family 92 protein n=1 Tax=Venustampulla echinocandica TaxID=2656787 RepID=A0A370TP41_9HELO|nr:uncharacterized protein BP5553_04717 [Venustampulla echinocandica]RDL37284.1 hypothetical protein BP5553_04717 [Venustampulla echinocandica]